MSCPSCEQMKKENKQLRTAISDTNKNYVEVINENLDLHRQVEASRKLVNQYKVRMYGDGQPGIAVEPSTLNTDPPDHNLIILQSIWAILDEVNGSEGFIRDLVANSIKSWKDCKASKTYYRENLPRPIEEEKSKDL